MEFPKRNLQQFSVSHNLSFVLCISEQKTAHSFLYVMDDMLLSLECLRMCIMICLIVSVCIVYIQLCKDFNSLKATLIHQALSPRRSVCGTFLLCRWFNKDMLAE